MVIMDVDYDGGDECCCQLVQTLRFLYFHQYRGVFSDRVCTVDKLRCISLTVLYFYPFLFLEIFPVLLKGVNGR